MDLSGTFHPQCFTCFKKELSVLVGKTSHYFKHVAVAGPVAQRLLIGLESGGKERERVIRDLQAHVALLLYIDKVGAREKIKFVTKPSRYCENCYRASARMAGLDVVADTELAKEYIDNIVETSKFRIMRNRAGNWQVAVLDSIFTEHEWSKEYGRTRPTRKVIASDLFESLTRPFVQDFLAAKQYKLPVVDTHPWLQMAASKPEPDEPKVEDVALRVNLPTLVGLDIEDFLRLEQENPDSYIKFQSAVREAVREAVKRHESRPSAEVAASVVEDFIKPEIAEIELKMKSAARSLTKKAGASVMVGATATSIGLLAAMPLAFTAIVGTAVASLTQVYKYIDDRGAIESSDMFFLWKASRITHDSTDSRY